MNTSKFVFSHLIDFENIDFLRKCQFDNYLQQSKQKNQRCLISSDALNYEIILYSTNIQRHIGVAGFGDLIIYDSNTILCQSEL